MNPFSSTSVIIFSAFLSVQAIGAFFLNRRAEYQPTIAPLASLPSTISAWRMVGEYPIEKEVQDVLRATDTVSRVYVDGKSPYPVSLFIAHFKSQRNGVAPHSPKNCLPGNGWVYVSNAELNGTAGGAGALCELECQPRTSGRIGAATALYSLVAKGPGS